MRYSVVGALVLLTASALVLRAEDPKDGKAAAPELDTLEKKFSYVLGVRLGMDLHRQGASVDPDCVARGLRDGLSGTAPVMSEAAMQQVIIEFQHEAQAKFQKHQAELGKTNKATGAAFLEKNKTAEGVKTTATGLQYKVLKEGQGKKATAEDTVVVDYEGRLIDGTIFDSSYAKGHPATFGVKQVIPGWTEGLQLMTEGSTFEFYIPSELAYGENPPPGPGPIGPNSVLIFKIELKEVKDVKKPK